MTYVGRGIDAISNVEKLDNITFDGSTTYNLTKSSVAFTPSGKNNILVSINGVVQQGNFTVAGATIIFDFSPSSNDTCNFIMHYGTGVLNVPADSSVNMAQLGASGTKSSSTFLAGDNTFKTVSGTTINTNADNRVITGSGTSNTLNGEANLRFDGSTVRVGSGTTSAQANGDDVVIEGSANTGLTILSGADDLAAVYLGQNGANNDCKFEYDNDTNALVVHTNATEAMKIDSNGHVTKPKQPCFFVYADQQSGVGSGTRDIPFANERFDLNADFSTPSFTAPVTGKYAFQMSVRIVNCQAGGNGSIYFQPSNAEIRAWRQDTDGDAGTYETASASIVIDMDANDTCKLQINSSVDADFIIDGATHSTYFSGYLVA